MGSLAMVDRGFRADAGIMTEPTGNRIAPLCHGILWGRIVIDGIGGHAELIGVPELGMAAARSTPSNSSGRCSTGSTS